MSKRGKRANLPQISAGKRLFCLLFSCPGEDNLPFCHRFQPGKDPFACFSHVPEAITYRSATDFNQEKTLLLDFLMSRRLEPTILPQIPARKRPLCLLFSCPGDDNLPFCHKFQLGKDSFACFSHVPEARTYHSATDFTQSRHSDKTARSQREPSPLTPKMSQSEPSPVTQNESN